jgi:hypothetical protein
VPYICVDFSFDRRFKMIKVTLWVAGTPNVVLHASVLSFFSKGGGSPASGLGRQVENAETLLMAALLPWGCKKAVLRPSAPLELVYFVRAF